MARGPWYDGTYYNYGQPFMTFAKHPESRPILKRMLKSLVANPDVASALEIGPGDSPLLEELPFRRRVYLDSSPFLAHNLKDAGLASPGSLSMAADLTRLPLGGPKFDVAVVNEVLTHLLPRQRLPAVRTLAGRAGALMIVDRHLVDAPTVQREAQQALARMAQRRNEHDRQDRLKSRAGTIKRLTAAQVAKDRASRVDFGPIQTLLESLGHRVSLDTCIYRGTGYTILTSKPCE